MSPSESLRVPWSPPHDESKLTTVKCELGGSGQLRAWSVCSTIEHARAPQSRTDDDDDDDDYDDILGRVKWVGPGCLAFLMHG